MVNFYADIFKWIYWLFQVRTAGTSKHTFFPTVAFKKVFFLIYY